MIDGTYELFRHYYALPSARDQDGREVAAVRGVLASVLGMIRSGAIHIAIATDHVIESFRNDLWPGYKTGNSIEPDLMAQFPLLEETLSRRLASSSGQWWSSRRMMHLLPRPWRQLGMFIRPASHPVALQTMAAILYLPPDLINSQVHRGNARCAIGSAPTYFPRIAVSPE